MAFLSGYSYRKSITLARASGAVTNYQMRLLVGESSGELGKDVDCNSHCKSDFSDLRFTTSDGTTLLDYWIELIEGTTPNQLATVWIEFDSIGTGDTTFYMYYGNAGASAYSNGENTFPLFDDFLGTSIDDTKWTYSGTPIVGGSEVNGSINSISTFGDNYALRCRAKVPAANQKYVVGWGDSQLATYDFSYRTPASDPQWAKEGFPSPGTTTSLATNFDANYHIFNIGKISTVTYFSMDNVNDGTLSPCSDPTLANKVVLYRADATWDWVLVRSYLAVEPVWGSWGSEESNVTNTLSVNSGALTLTGSSVELIGPDIPVSNRYWVGNTGLWTDTAHWSETSGGAGGATVPTVNDNVHFDSNSFTEEGQHIEFS